MQDSLQPLVYYNTKTDEHIVRICKVSKYKVYCIHEFTCIFLDKNMQSKILGNMALSGYTEISCSTS